MILRLDAAVPVVWRTPDSLQFGVDRPRVVLEGVDRVDEALIAALGPGIPRSGADLIATSLGARATRVDALLSALRPVLVPTDAAPARGSRPVAVCGTGPLADEVRRVLDAGGTEVAGDSPDDARAAVLVAGFAVVPSAAASWLRRDIPHLAVVVGDAEVRIGPVVGPQAGPCERCLALARTDDDPAWPAMATQLAGRRIPPLPADVQALTAALASGMLRDTARPVGGALVVDVLTGRISERGFAAHPACGCRSLPGTATPSAWTAAAPVPTTTSVGVVAVPA